MTHETVPPPAPTPAEAEPAAAAAPVTTESAALAAIRAELQAQEAAVDRLRDFREVRTALTADLADAKRSHQMDALAAVGDSDEVADGDEESWHGLLSQFVGRNTAETIATVGGGALADMHRAPPILASTLMAGAPPALAGSSSVGGRSAEAAPLIVGDGDVDVDEVLRDVLASLARHGQEALERAASTDGDGDDGDDDVYSDCFEGNSDAGSEDDGVDADAADAEKDSAAQPTAEDAVAAAVACNDDVWLDDDNPPWL